MLAGNLADNQLTSNPAVAILLGSSPCFGAWFLWCLFVMTMVVLCFKKINIWILLIVSVVLNYIPVEYGDNCMGLEKTQENLMWVLFGCIVRKYYVFISSKKNIYVGFGAALVLIVLHLRSGFLGQYNYFVAHGFTLVKTLSGIIASFTFCFLLTLHSSCLLYKGLKLCGCYCMDIYILSMFVLVPLRILYVNVGIMNYIPYYDWLIISTILGVVLPIIVSKYVVRKTKTLKILLLGG